MRLPTRFVFLTNELPRLSDASGALAGRFVTLRMLRSFYGEEDTTLESKLMAELPGILLWAIEGLKRLRKRGHFVQPASVEDAVREMQDLASPVGAFVRECCEVSPSRRVTIDALYRKWQDWCAEDGRTSSSTKQTFCRDLLAAVAGIVRRRNHDEGRFYEGIGLKAPECF
jgi:putative DNA primase/helicase